MIDPHTEEVRVHDATLFEEAVGLQEHKIAACYEISYQIGEVLASSLELKDRENGKVALNEMLSTLSRNNDGTSYFVSWLTGHTESTGAPCRSYEYSGRTIYRAEGDGVVVRTYVNFSRNLNTPIVAPLLKTCVQMWLTMYCKAIIDADINAGTIQI